MIQQITNSKRFGPFPVGNPLLVNYPKHSNVIDAFSDMRVIALDILEVRSQTKVHVVLSASEASVSELELLVPREYNKFNTVLSSKFRTERNPKPKFRLVSYDYVI